MLIRAEGQIAAVYFYSIQLFNFKFSGKISIYNCFFSLTLNELSSPRSSQAGTTHLKLKHKFVKNIFKKLFGNIMFKKYFLPESRLIQQEALADRGDGRAEGNQADVEIHLLNLKQKLLIFAGNNFFLLLFFRQTYSRNTLFWYLSSVFERTSQPVSLSTDKHVFYGFLKIFLREMTCFFFFFLFFTHLCHFPNPPISCSTSSQVLTDGILKYF